MIVLGQAVESLRAIPRSILAFSALHVFAGCVVLWLLFTSRCVDTCPPGTYCLGGCHERHEAWRDDYAQYALGIIVLFLASSLGLLCASRVARLALLGTMVAFFAFDFYVSIKETKEYLDMLTGEKHGWVAAWNERLENLVPIEWLLPVAWVSLNSWYLFGTRARRFFARAA